MNVARHVTIRVPAGAWNLKPDWPERAQHALAAFGIDIAIRQTLDGWLTCFFGGLWDLRLLVANLLSGLLVEIVDHER